MIRAAKETDLPRLLDIYNSYVLESYATFDTEPVSLEQRRTWFQSFSLTGPHRLLVAELDGQVAGYTSSHRIRPRAAYFSSIETSVYLAKESTGKGLGKALYAQLFEVLDSIPSIHRIYAAIALPNPASVRLHEHFAFKQCGLWSEAGYKFGKFWDVVWYERRGRS